MKPPLCLNMIVKNEADRIERCLASVLPYVKSAVILDTGSTDGTILKIEGMCAVFGVPFVVEEGKFENFSQARNDAYSLARRLNGYKHLPYTQFVLLMDADMELVVDDPKAFDDLSATAPSYDMMQKGGAVSYGNRRLVNLMVNKPIYVGVTHEYIDVPASGMIEKARFIDHADGSNRKDKYERDALLLEEALKTEPDNGRYWYYLGNTYRDAGKHLMAIQAYNKRITLGGWDEEVHSAMMHLADCYRADGQIEKYVAGMLDAYAFRPCRAEPLYELAKFYREGNKPTVALAFAEQGLAIPRPYDVLFVNDFVYEHGLCYEFSIAAYYGPRPYDREDAGNMTNMLALDPTCDEHIRYSSRSNLFWHTKPLREFCPSFTAERIQFEPPAGYVATNPSVTVSPNRVTATNVRCVNYTINEHGAYMIGEKGCGDAPIVTRNFVITPFTTREIIWHRPPAAFDLVIGLEDIRLWYKDGELHFNACVREQSPNGTCQQIVGKLTPDVDPQFLLVSSWKIVSGEDAHEKNWMHLSGSEFVYRLDTILDVETGAVTKHKCDVYPDLISGSSQCISFKGGHLAVVHEAVNNPQGKRTYWHRFVWFNSDREVRRITKPFVFYENQIEFCAGLALAPNGFDLLISFGVRDAEAHTATVSVDEVARMLWDFHED